MPPTTSFVSSTDQPRQYVVNDFVKQPTLVQSVVPKMLNKQFIADGLLRRAPAAPGGVVKFFEDEPMFADGIEIVAEYGEIPVMHSGEGTPRAVFTRKGAGALVVSKEMRTRNDMDAVNKQLRRIRNSFVRFWDDAFMQAILTNPVIQGNKTPVALPWTDDTAKVRRNLAEGKEDMLGRTDENGNELLFTPDTLVIHPLRAEALTYNNDVAKVFSGNIADQDPIIRGDLGRDLGGLRIIKSFRMPVDHALILERQTVGFISDEWALDTTAMYEIRERQSYRSDTTRLSAVGIDAPKAAQLLVGV